MEQRNVVITLAITLVLCMFTAKVRAYDFKYEGLYYNINADGETVSLTYREAEGNESQEGKRYLSGYEGNIVVPETVTYKDKVYTVIAVGDFAMGNVIWHNLHML